VGANIGYLTYFFCRRVGQYGQVYSFEPDVANFRELSTNVQRNRIVFCHPLQVAVGAADGAVSFAPGLNGHIAPESRSLPTCPLVSLDSFVRREGITHVDLVKIDVEGWELDVLEGMRQMLASGHKPIIYVEVHPKGFSHQGDPEAVCSLLKRYYCNICAYRTWSDIRSQLPSGRRLRNALFRPRDSGRPVAVSLGEAHLCQERFQLLCLPDGCEGTATRR